MKRNSSIARNEADFSGQLQTFKLNIPGYATTLGVTPAEVASQAADANYFKYCLDCAMLFQNAAQEWTAWKSIIRAGGAPPPTGVPVAPVLPEEVPAVAPGIEARFRALVKKVKSHPAYNDAIGEALGIVGAEMAPPDFATVQPDFEVKVNGGAVLVDWSWLKWSHWLDMIELEVDRGDGKGFVTLAFDTTPGYTDTEPFPPTPVKRTYRGIYRVGDQRVGQWSKPVAVLVG